MTKTLTELLGQNAEATMPSPLVAVFDGEWAHVEDCKYLSFRPKGISFATDLNERITSIFLYSDGYENFRGYPGPIPHSISFSSSRSVVRKKLGVPNSAGDGEVVPILGKGPPWDKYEFASYSLLIDYSERKDSILLITLAALES